MPTKGVNQLSRLPKPRKINLGVEKAREDGGVYPSGTDRLFVIQEKR